MAEPGAKTPSYEEAYQKLRQSYVVRLGNSLEAIRNVLSQRQLGKLSRDDMARAQHLVHGLAGSGAIFGFPAVTEAGREADVFLSKTLRDLPEGGTMDDGSFDALEKLLLGLRQACESAVNGAQEGEMKLELSGRTARGPSAFHVVVVDDDREIGALLQMRLQQKGIRVTLARSGDAALQAVAKAPPDLIILDISMPGLSGHEVLRRLKQNPEYVAVPVLMLTGKADQTDVVSALHSGAIDYILKPFNPAALLARVEKILDAARYNVLIADNDPLILQLLDNRFRHAGFKVTLSEDGGRAWEKIVASQPHLVVLDRMMPGLDGLTVLRNMRAEYVTKGIPVILLSACKTKGDIESGLQAGAQDYVTKPFLPDDLIARSLKLLKNGGV